MAKKVKFSLIMADGASITNGLDDLQAHFDIESVVKYFHSGQLAQWLEDRYYDEEAESVQLLDADEPNLKQKLCSILGVSSALHAGLDEFQQKRLEEKKALLMSKTSDESIIALAPQTAFTQEDLADLLDMGETTIYLCGDSFNIPVRMTGKNYIGILGTPKIKVNAKSDQEITEKQISFKNIQLPWCNTVVQAELKSSKPPAIHKIDEKVINSAKKLLTTIKDPKFRNWANCNVWFTPGIPSTYSKSALEKTIREGAREVERELPNDISDCVGIIIGKLNDVQNKYDELFTKSNLPTKLIKPDLNTVSYQLRIAGDEAKRYKPFDLASELISAVRYDAMESADFSGIFGGKDYMIANDSELDKISDSYCKKVSQRLINSNGGQFVEKYLNAMAYNLQSVFLSKK